jgi:hypothetical protein
MVRQSQTSLQRLKYVWTDDREQVYIDCLLEAAKQGKRINIGWKLIVVSEIADIFHFKEFPAVIKSQLDSKRDEIYDPRSIGPDLY